MPLIHSLNKYPPTLHTRRPSPPPPLPPPCTDLLPLAVGGKLLGRDKDTEFEDGLELGGKPLGLKVLELSLGLPDERHIQAQAEHADGAGSGGQGERGAGSLWMGMLPVGEMHARYARPRLSLAA